MTLHFRQVQGEKNYYCMKCI